MSKSHVSMLSNGDVLCYLEWRDIYSIFFILPCFNLISMTQLLLWIFSTFFISFFRPLSLWSSIKDPPWSSSFTLHNEKSPRPSLMHCNRTHSRHSQGTVGVLWVYGRYRTDRYKVDDSSPHWRREMVIVIIIDRDGEEEESIHLLIVSLIMIRLRRIRREIIQIKLIQISQ